MTPCDRAGCQEPATVHAWPADESSGPQTLCSAHALELTEESSNGEVNG